MMLTPLRCAFIFVAMLASARAQFVDTFAAFPGSATVPWTGPWVFDRSPGVGVSPVVGDATVSLQNTAPLSPTAGQYLTVSTEHIAGGFDNISFATSLTRTYASAPGLDLNSTHLLSFQFRLDDLVQGDFTHLWLGGMRNTVDASWGLFMGFPAIHRSTWMFGQGDGTGGARFVDTGLVPTAGHTYQVDLTLRPQLSNYDIALHDLTAGLDASGTFNYQKSPVSFAGITENFYLSVTTASAMGDRLTYSLDNVRVSGAVPEPSTYGLFAAVALLAVAVRTRRRSL